MLARLEDHDESYVPTYADEQIAKAGLKKLESASIIPENNGGVEIYIKINNNDISVPAPEAMARFIINIMKNMAAGRPFSLVPSHAMLTTQQAADFLNVSRPYFIKLLEKDKKIPFETIGRHRRVKFADLIDYERSIRKKRDAILHEMAFDSQNLNLE
jgi:excisionase family DNA binding protein